MSATSLPKIGQRIYVPSESHVPSKGTVRIGGLATVSLAKESRICNAMVPMIETNEHPGVRYNWNSLHPQQDELQKTFGRKKAHEQKIEKKEKIIPRP